MQFSVKEYHVSTMGYQSGLSIPKGSQVLTARHTPNGIVIAFLEPDAYAYSEYRSFYAQHPQMTFDYLDLTKEYKFIAMIPPNQDPVVFYEATYVFEVADKVQ